MLRDALTVPNGVSLARLLAVPYFWWVLLATEQITLAAVLIFVIGSTDWLDGYLARRLDQVSELGKMLDPLADRLMIASAVVGGSIAGVLPAVIAIPLIVRELLIAVGGLYLGTRGGGKLDVRYLGKVATFLIYGAVPSFYLDAAGVVPWMFGPAAWISGAIGLVLYWWVAAEYLGDLRIRLRDVGSAARRRPSSPVPPGAG